MDQVFAVKQMCEQYPANEKDVFWAFMDLKKAYDVIDQHGMWQKPRVYRVGGKLLKAVQSFFMLIGFVSEYEWMWVSGFRLLLD